MPISSPSKCLACNNVWMSRLEEAVKPTLTALLDRQKDLHQLSGAEAQTLARWAAKTAIIESHAIAAECPVDSRLLRRFATYPNEAPGRFAAVAARAPISGLGHFPAGLIQDLVGGGKAAGHIIVLQIKDLILTVAFPMLEVPFNCSCDLQIYTPLWPPAPAWQPLPPRSIPDPSDSTKILITFAEAIQLFHPL